MFMDFYFSNYNHSNAFNILFDFDYLFHRKKILRSNHEREGKSEFFFYISTSLFFAPPFSLPPNHTPLLQFLNWLLRTPGYSVSLKHISYGVLINDNLLQTTNHPQVIFLHFYLVSFLHHTHLCKTKGEAKFPLP